MTGTVVIEIGALRTALIAYLRHLGPYRTLLALGLAILVALGTLGRRP